MLPLKMRMLITLADEKLPAFSIHIPLGERTTANGSTTAHLWG